MFGTLMVAAIEQIEMAKTQKALEDRECAEQWEKDPEGFPAWLQRREEAKERATKAATEERRHRELVAAVRTKSSGPSAFLGGLIGFMIGSSGN